MWIVTGLYPTRTRPQRPPKLKQGQEPILRPEHMERRHDYSIKSHPGAGLAAEHVRHRRFHERDDRCGRASVFRALQRDLRALSLSEDPIVCLPPTDLPEAASGPSAQRKVRRKAPA